MVFCLVEIPEPDGGVHAACGDDGVFDLQTADGGLVAFEEADAAAGV